MTPKIQDDRRTVGSGFILTADILSRTASGRDILERDWSDSGLGPLSRWPTSLSSILAMILECPTPMFLAWGPELRSFFNDAYRPVLGQRLKGATGQPFRVLWSDIWSDIGPLVDATLSGEARHVADMKLDLQREGVSEESWWTFSYSPVRDETGAIAGMICVTGETTERIVAERDRDAADERLELALSSGNGVGTWDWDIVADRFVADERFARLYGIDPGRAAAGTPIAHYFGKLHPDDAKRVADAIDAAVSTGVPFAQEYRLLSDGGTTRWVLAQGRPLLDEEGAAVRLSGINVDITDRKRAELGLADALDERRFIMTLTSRQRELDSPDAILRVSADALRRRLGVDRCGFVRVLPRARIRIGPRSTADDDDALSGEHSIGVFGERLRRAWETGTTLSFADSRDDRLGGLEALTAVGAIAGLYVPFLREGRFSCALFAHASEVRAWTSGEIELMREIGELTLLAIERVEAVIRLETRVDQQESALVQQAGVLREEAAGRSAAENQVRQLQKMEAVGQLTGGIAHDFNNMLAVVIGGLDLLQRRIARGDVDVGKYVNAAMDGAKRAAALTQRLLAFSRQSPLAPEPVNLNVMVSGLTELLDRTLGERVGLETVLGAGLWKARADPGQLENVIVNLAVNARDAMPDGGTLTIETSNAQLDERYAAREAANPGQYVMIAVSDTGTGMPAEVIGKAFEPFFTTKGVGKGTGLGLSQVFGFVRQSGGHVKIYSEVGHGTTVRVYLPRVFGDETWTPAVRTTTAARLGDPSEVILVVEDEERLRAFSVEALRDLGYTVIHACDGLEALAMIDAGQSATLLFTDIVMPGITGRQLADAALERLPGLKVLFTTGYTRNAVVHNGTLDPGTNFLAKPFGLDDLARKVREVIDGA